MADSAKYVPVGGSLPPSDLKALFSHLKTRKTVALAYAFMFAFVAFTVFLAFSPSPNASSPWFSNIFSSSSSSSSLFSFFSPRTPSPPSTSRSDNSTPHLTSTNTQVSSQPVSLLNHTLGSANSSDHPLPSFNHTVISSSTTPRLNNLTADSPVNPPVVLTHNQTAGSSDVADESLETNRTEIASPPPEISSPPPPNKAPAATPARNISSALKSNSPVRTSPEKSTDYTASLAKKRSNGTGMGKKDGSVNLS